MDTICTYCGDPATVLDHAVPHSYSSPVPGRVRNGGSDPGDRVPCCVDCNTILGAVVLPSIEDRRAYVLGRLKRRLKESPRWTRAELDELGPTLRAEVEARLAADRRLIARIAFAEFV